MKAAWARGSERHNRWTGSVEEEEDRLKAGVGLQAVQLGPIEPLVRVKWFWGRGAPQDPGGWKQHGWRQEDKQEEATENPNTIMEPYQASYISMLT